MVAVGTGWVSISPSPPRGSEEGVVRKGLEERVDGWEGGRGFVSVVKGIDMDKRGEVAEGFKSG